MPRSIRSVALAVTVALCAGAASAASKMSASALAQPDVVRPGDSFSVKLLLEVDGLGGDLEIISEPDFAPFEELGRSSSSEFSIVNFKPTATKSRLFQLRAPSDLKEGEYTIKPISFAFDGKTHQTEPIKIKISRAAPPSHSRSLTPSAPPSPIFPPGFFPGRSREIEKDDLRFALELSKVKTIPGDYVIATFVFKSAIELWNRPRLAPPTFEGFLIEEIRSPTGAETEESVESIGSRSYTVTRKRYALIPLAPGVGKISAARIIVSPDPWSESIALSSNPAQVQIEQPPWSDQPTGFNGLIGSYEIKASLVGLDERNSITVGSSASLEISIEGDGYIGATPPSAPVETPGQIEFFDPKVDDEIRFENGRLISKRLIEIPLIARRPGKISIAPIEIVSFNPQTQKFQSAFTEPIELLVEPDPNQTQRALDVGENHGARPDFVSKLQRRADLTALADESSRVYKSPLFIFMAIGAPLLLIGIALAARRRFRRIALDPALARRKGAKKRALDALDQAPDEIDPKEADRILRSFIADLCACPATMVDREFLDRLATGDDRERSAELLDEIERLRYAPKSTRSTGIGSNGSLKERLEKIIRAAPTRWAEE